VKGLTEIQAKLLNHLRAEIDQRGYPPTIREINAAFGWKSTNSTSEHLTALQKKGYITRTPTAGRGITILGPGGVPVVPASRTVKVPVYRSFSGPPPWLEADVVEVMTCSEQVVGSGAFGLRVAGYGLQGAGVMAGDVLIFSKRPIVPGCLAAVQVGEDVLVRRVWPNQPDGTYLRAANPAVPDIVVPDWRHTMAIGVAVVMMRRVELTV